MSTRPATSALVLALLVAACDAGITEPSYQHFAALSLAGDFSCGLDADGRVSCWGTENGVGQLGIGTNAPSATPIRVKTGARFRQVVTGAAHACALNLDGRAFCWGDNSAVQIGVTDADLDCNLLQPNGWVQDFGNACSLVPAPVQTDLRFVRLGAGVQHTCGLTGGGEIWCWGVGVLGDSAATGRSAVPVRVSSPARFTTLTVGAWHTCAADRDGLGWCWGYNGFGALGLGMAGATTNSGYVPTRINSSAFLKGFGVGRYHTCAVTGSHAVLCWGYGPSGQRGDSTTTATMHDPVFVRSDRAFAAVVAAGDGTCGIEVGSGAAWCWGENSSGQLGTGTTLDQLAPTEVLGGLAFSSLVMGGPPYSATATTCGVAEESVYCWGLIPQPLTFEE